MTWNEDSIELVQYSIVSIERDRERVLVCDACKVLSEAMSECTFETWVIADYCQRHPIPESEARSLRVVHRVLARWKKRPLEFESRQLEELERIELAIRGRCDPARLGGRGAQAREGAEEAKANSKPGLGSDKRADEAREMDLGEAERQLTAVLAGLGGEAAMGQLKRETGLGRAAVAGQLQRLMAAGLVRRVGTGFKTRYRLVKH